MEAVLYLQFNEHDQGITVPRIDQNVLDRVVQTVYELTVTPDGKLQVVAKTEDTDKALPQDWGGTGEYDTSGLRNMANSFIAQLNTAIDGYLQNYENDITSVLNGSTGWVYPGGNTFLFKDAGFSGGQDLIAHITYADPA